MQDENTMMREDPDVLSELKIDPARAYPFVDAEGKEYFKKAKYPNTLGLPDVTEPSLLAQKCYSVYRVKSGGRLQPRPEAFAQLVARDDDSLLACFLKAGYAGGQSAMYNASILARKPEVHARICQLKTENWYHRNAPHDDEISEIIQRLDDREIPDLGPEMLMRQYAINLKMAREAGDMRQANRALAMLAKLAHYQDKVRETKPGDMYHPNDRPDAEKDNYKVLEEIEVEVEKIEDDHKRANPPPTAEEVDRLLHELG